MMDKIINPTPESIRKNRERDRMAQVISEITCGLEGAIPEQDDYDLADKCIKFIEEELKR